MRNLKDLILDEAWVRSRPGALLAGGASNTHSGCNTRKRDFVDKHKFRFLPTASTLGQTMLVLDLPNFTTPVARVQLQMQASGSSVAHNLDRL
jgi:hypothetical protein